MMHPESRIGKIPEEKLLELVKDVRDYSLLFYAWKKKFELKKNWKIYKKGMCPRCELKTIRAYLGKTPRLTTYCPNCQQLYNGRKKRSGK